MENHRTIEGAENSMVWKLYSFAFFNSYISFFVYAFWARSFIKLAQNLANFMIIKQIVLNLLDLYKLKVTVRKRIETV